MFVSLLAGACCAALAGCAKGEGPVSGEEINVAVQVNVDARALESTDGTPTAAEAELHSLRVYAFIGDELVGCPGEEALVRLGHTRDHDCFHGLGIGFELYTDIGGDGYCPGLITHIGNL